MFAMGCQLSWCMQYRLGKILCGYVLFRAASIKIAHHSVEG